MEENDCSHRYHEPDTCPVLLLARIAELEAVLAAVRQGITTAEKPTGDTSDLLDLVGTFIEHHKTVEKERDDYLDRGERLCEKFGPLLIEVPDLKRALSEVEKNSKENIRLLTAKQADLNEAREKLSDVEKGVYLWQEREKQAQAGWRKAKENWEHRFATVENREQVLREAVGTFLEHQDPEGYDKLDVIHDLARVYAQKEQATVPDVEERAEVATEFVAAAKECVKYAGGFGTQVRLEKALEKYDARKVAPTVPNAKKCDHRDGCMADILWLAVLQDEELLDMKDTETEERLFAAVDKKRKQLKEIRESKSCTCQLSSEQMETGFHYPECPQYSTKGTPNRSDL